MFSITFGQTEYIAMPAEFITDHFGNKKAVVLPLKDYNSLLEKVEELEAIKAYDKAIKRKQTFSSADDVFARLDKLRK